MTIAPYGWPWGGNRPTRARRLFVAAAVATLAAVLIVYKYQFASPYETDFSFSWFGARALLDHQDPYQLVGPALGLPFRSRYPLPYPVTALVAVMPLARFPEYIAHAIFVWVSSLLLVYGMTAKSWHLLPLIASISFLVNIDRGQYTILITAMLFLPAVACFAIVKPHISLPAIVTSERASSWYAAFLGGIVLVAASLLVLPGWPAEWFSIVRHNPGHLQAPIARPLGFLLALSLIRWKRPEAWFVFLLSCAPQSWDFYNTLPLLAIAATYREACLLSMLSTLGGFLWLMILPLLVNTPDQFFTYSGTLIVIFAYLPAVFTVLLRPNEGSFPGAFLFRARAGKRAVSD